MIVAALFIGATSYGMGLALWQGIAIAAVAGLLMVADIAFHRFREARGQHTRAQLAFQDGRRCKSCNGDLWGLDVLPGKGGAYRVKCPECGVTTDFKAGKRAAKPKPQRVAEDTRSFKIR